VSRSHGAAQRWLFGPSLVAAWIRGAFIVFGCSCGLVIAYVGVAPFSPSNGGSGIQAVIDSCFAVAFIGLGYASGVSKRRRRRLERPRPDPGRIVYDKWLVLAVGKPWIALFTLACIRAICHFYAHSVAGPAAVVFYAASALTVIWLFIVGPIFRPMNWVVVSGRLGFTDGRSWLK
jgi:hypothetical protein